jgi:transcriptional regulator with XRE-family HTH domain
MKKLTSTVAAPAKRPALRRAPAPLAEPVPPPVAIGARLRHARLLKGLLMKDLAAQVGVSISLISKYENDKLLPPLTVLHALVTALDTHIGALFDTHWSGTEHVARAGTRPCIAAGGDGDAAGVTLERLIPAGRGQLLQGNIHIVAPGGGSMGPMQHEGDEVGYVLEGRLELTIGEVNHMLAAGDSFAFPSHLAHTYRNPGLTVARVLWINTPPTF